jgi:hypothetical protein
MDVTDINNKDAPARESQIQRDVATAINVSSGTDTPASLYEYTVTIEASGSWTALDLKEVWAYRELLFSDVARCQSALQTNAFRRGVGNPATAFTMLIFSLFFGKLAGINPIIFRIRFSLTRDFCRGHFFQRRHQQRQQSRGQCQSHH